MAKHTPDSMHHCLNVDEIVRLIVHELVASGRKATAVLLACCCKSFEDPVLDALWETQVGLPLLFECFPGDVWNEGGYGTFKRPPTATEWARFRKYARRMRALKGQVHGVQGVQYLEAHSVLQLHAVNEPLLPNLTTLDLWTVRAPLLQILPFILSPTITSISLRSVESHLPRSVVASAIADLLAPCPNVQDINLPSLPRDPMITTAVSDMFFAANQNALRRFHVDSPLTEEANQALYKSQNLCSLSVVIERGTPIPSASLPNLICLQIECEDGSDGLQLFHGATFGKLKSVKFYIESRLTDGFLEEFQGAALSSSIQNTLSAISLITEWSWNPHYYSLLPFTRLVDLNIRSPCDDSCSTMEDDIVTDLSRAMPKLETLRLGDRPCHRSTGGVTAKGLVGLVRNCPYLSSLCVHFQVASLSDPPTGLEMTRDAGNSASWTGCALRVLEVGEIPIPEGSGSTVALALLRIFPRIESIAFGNAGWAEVEDTIRRSRRIVDS